MSADDDPKRISELERQKEKEKRLAEEREDRKRKEADPYLQTR